MRDDKQLVEPDAPVFEKRLRDIDPNDLRLEDFWIEGVQGAPTEPIPLTHRTVADLVERVKDGVVNLYTRILQEREACA